MTNKIIFPFLIGFVFIFVSCENSALVPDYEINTPFQINIGDIASIYLEDIEYYDQSSHLFYLKEELLLPSNAYIISTWITAGTDFILSGYYNGPIGKCDTTYLVFKYRNDWNYPFIFELNYSLPMNMTYFEKEILPEKPELLYILEQNNKLMKGLDVSIESIERVNSTHLVMNLKIYNADTVNYYYPDADKMGADFYHGLSLCSGLRMFNNDSTFFINHDMLDVYSDDVLLYPTWLSLIKSGETKQMQVNYNEFDTIQLGNYYALFEFNSLPQYIDTTSEIKLDSGRVWLGSTVVATEIELK